MPGACYEKACAHCGNLLRGPHASMPWILQQRLCVDCAVEIVNDVYRPFFGLTYAARCEDMVAFVSTLRMAVTSVEDQCDCFFVCPRHSEWLCSSSVSALAVAIRDDDDHSERDSGRAFPNLRAGSSGLVIDLTDDARGNTNSQLRRLGPLEELEEALAPYLIHHLAPCNQLGLEDYDDDLYDDDLDVAEEDSDEESHCSYYGGEPSPQSSIEDTIENASLDENLIYQDDGDSQCSHVAERGSISDAD